MLTAKCIATAAMLVLVPLAAVAAPAFVETRPAFEFSSSGAAARIDLGDTASSFRSEGPPLIDFGGAEDGHGASLQTRMFESQAVVRCRIENADLLFANAGSDAIEAGTTIRWQVKGRGQRGYFNLEQPLGAGEALRARDALSEAAAEATTCSARAV